MDKLLKQVILSMKIMGYNNFNPIGKTSEKWNHWITNFGPRTCFYCAKHNGKIFAKEAESVNIPVHINCNCELQSMLAISIGTATIERENGADNWIYLFNRLPTQYVTKEVARTMGWNSILGNLRKKIPNAVIGGDIYNNYNQKLPIVPGRIWYEADINYTGGYRNSHRILYSNDGLMFVTYDHYNTFYELVQKG